jgi:hypothetical protein
MLIEAKQVKNFSYVVVDDFYDVNELTNIKIELKNLLEYAQNPKDTFTALDENKELKKKGSGLFVDDLYLGQRENSAILTFNRKLFCDEIVNEAVKLNQFFKILHHCDYDRTLVNFYQTGDEYREHRDHCAITAITFFSLGSVTGGDLVFPESGEVVEFKENRMVIFCGCALHATTPLITEDSSHRVSIAQFLNYLPNRKD